MSKILIVGGGAAGMFASVFAGRNGNEVHVFEKNEKLGKKLFITGKGRCNLTNSSDMENVFESVQRNRKFLYSSFYGFTNNDTIEFFEKAGMPIKIERGNRVFPLSDRSSDVISTLKKEMKKAGVEVHLNKKVANLLIDDKKVSGIVLEGGEKIEAEHVIVATGGFSYQSTGSTGDGYEFARTAGLAINEISPSLVPLVTQESYVTRLQGLSLKNVEVSIYENKKRIFQDFGEMLFTHFGVSGPLILSASSIINENIKKHPLLLSIDLKPALTLEQLDKRVIREFKENKNKQFKNTINSLFPAKLIPIMIELSEISPEKQVNEISKEERTRFVQLIKNLQMTITGFRDYNEAIITRGGVHIKEVDPSTMESKKIRGLYFIGEVLDLDALTGGFNLQIAWSTAYAAGNSMKKREETNGI
ncbi:BaiN/RdsA family NAD(P)/FAD-dependent oxidoreductase [Anaerosacchariphilus polymeriproducens]|uniref:NAD(P)/FAD-dependent oxidoreductase n=1 Tax=Anaerosacchariphilus polymeriproducens TaxID=1812858 RepID=A0A371AU78_9FIRM|nr:NAD(P)/FAD-dependent oxidoreductase [Anaerosacchariphilus polymeriproducens]RDU23127.1 NAD(P)/FAD-dependent oxidoreductase [Anaerosacchariphilus polymeriproducens]